MKRYDSDPFELEAAGGAAVASVEGAGYTRADLVFYGVDHSGPSYQAYIYLDNPEADFDTPPDAEHGFAGMYTIFGHGGCYGSEGHCDANDRTSDEFDVRAPHPINPYTISVEITEALRRVTGSEVQVTVIPREPGSRGPKLSDAMRFEHLRLLTYEDQ